MLPPDLEPHPDRVRVRYRLFKDYEARPPAEMRRRPWGFRRDSRQRSTAQVHRSGTHLVRASGAKGDDAAADVNLTDGTEVPLVVREPHWGRRSMVGTYHVHSIRALASGGLPETNLGFDEANAYVAKAWAPGLQEHLLLRHTWRVGDLVAWSNRLVIHTATSTAPYASSGEQRLHTRIRMRAAPEFAPRAWADGARGRAAR